MFEGWTDISDDESADDDVDDEEGDVSNNNKNNGSDDSDDDNVVGRKWNKRLDHTPVAPTTMGDGPRRKSKQATRIISKQKRKHDLRRCVADALS